MDVDQLVARYGTALLANARRHSANAADADDAYQRALEILLTKAPEDSSEEQIVAWLRTVVRNEALQIHRKQRAIVDGAFDELAEEWVREIAPPDEELVDQERLAQGREALSKLKPDQSRCLLLRADGLDYPEICEVTGFSYAKVNRCLSEGRKSFRERVARIESGAECRQIEGLLSMIADGEAPLAARAEAEPHIKNCLYCQATLRDYNKAPDRALAALPLGIAALSGSEQSGWLQRIAQPFESAYAWIQEKLAAHAPTLAHGGEVAPAKKAAMVLALSATIVAGGVTVDKAVKHSDDPAPKADGAAATGGVKPLAVAPIHQSKPAKRTHHRKSSAQAKPRAATSADVVGKDAGTPVENASDPAPVGNSIPGGADTESSSPAPGGSSSQNPDLAP